MADYGRARVAGVAVDALLRNTTRVLTLLALVAFLGWIAVLNPILLLTAIFAAFAAYAVFRADQTRHPMESNVGKGRDRDDRVMEGSRKAVSPGASAAGIHLSFESRSRWRRR